MGFAHSTVMNAKRQLGLLVWSACIFYALVFGGLTYEGFVGGKPLVGVLAIVALFVLPVFFLYLPLRFIVSHHRYLVEEPFIRFPAFAFSVSPLVLSILFYAFFVF